MANTPPTSPLTPLQTCSYAGCGQAIYGKVGYCPSCGTQVIAASKPSEPTASAAPKASYAAKTSPVTKPTEKTVIPKPSAAKKPAATTKPHTTGFDIPVNNVPPNVAQSADLASEHTAPAAEAVATTFTTADTVSPAITPVKPKSSLGKWFKYGVIATCVYGAANWYIGSQKQENLLQLCEDAKAAFKKGDYAVANRIGDVILNKDPKNVCAKDVQKKADAALIKKQREQERQNKAEAERQEAEAKRQQAEQDRQRKELEALEAQTAAAQAAAKVAQDNARLAEERQKQIVEDTRKQLALERQKQLAEDSRKQVTSERQRQLQESQERGVQQRIESQMRTEAAQNAEAQRRQEAINRQINNSTRSTEATRPVTVDKAQEIREQIREHFRAIGEAKAKRQWSVALDRARQILKLEPTNKEAQRQIDEINRITSNGFNNL